MIRKELKEVIETGDARKIYEYVKPFSKEEIEVLEDAIIEKDKTGEWTYYLARDVPGVNIKKLQDAVIEKDFVGIWLLELARHVKGVDVKKIQDVLMERDRTGEWLCWLAMFVEGVDIKSIHNRLIELAEENPESEEWLEYLEEKIPELTENNTNDIER